MQHTRFRFAIRWSLVVLVVLGPTAAATANYYELLRRVPESANAIILIDTERMLMSPIAMKEKWRDKANSAEGETLHLPINAERYMLASKLNYVSDFDNIWDIALIETTHDVSLPYLSKMEGGYLDTVEGQQVAYSPRNAFFVSLKPTILGVSFPANRQDLGRWLRSLKGHDKPQISEYLEGAVTLGHGKDQLVAAFDLSDLLTSRQVRDLLHHAESLAGKNLDLDVLTKVLTSVKGVTMTVEASDRINGKVRVDFGESAAPLRPVAKAMIFEALEHNGMLLDEEIKNWAVAVEAKAVTLQGRLSTKGLRQLTDLIPFPAETVALKESESKAGAAAPQNAASTEDLKVATSKKYYQKISLLLEELRGEVKAAGSPKLARRLVDRAATELDRMPVLNVDDELLAYGTGVSATLRDMRNLSKNASLDAAYRQAGFAGNQGGGYGYGGFYGGTSLTLATDVMRKQQDALLRSNQLAAFTMLQEKTAEIRRKMTLKYKVEF
jgi:hypothetical protein